MKNILFLIVILVVNVNLQSQDILNGIIEYDNIINNQTGVSFAISHKLYFNAKTSFYERVGDAEKIVENPLNDENEFRKSKVNNTVKVVKNILPSRYYYTNTVTGELIFRESVVGNLFIVNDSIEDIPWVLHNEDKKIGDYTCQKATGLYRGREYTVWFTAEIPISHGPWKLRGLPGLIMEAFDDSGRYEFRATKVSLNNETKDVSEKLKRPDTSENICDVEVYINAIKSKQKDTWARALASLPKGAELIKECDGCPKAHNMSIEIF